MTGVTHFLQARDFLLEHRTDYGKANVGFSWPVLDEFNWALDYFDAMAQGNSNLALWIVGEDGSERKLTFRELSKRSNQVANLLRSLGVSRGDHVLIMLGNEVPLWETMLALIKLGAVLIPATMLLSSDDLRDRIERGNVKHAIVGAAHVEKLAGLVDRCTRVCVGGSREGWTSYDYSRHGCEFMPTGVTKARDPLLLYFTSGTTSKPKLVLHSHQSYPVGHLSTMYWIGLKPGDIHLNISSPGWAKHAWSCFFAPWNAGACVFVFNYTRFNAKAMLEVLASCGVTTMCAPPTVWRMLIQEDLPAYRDRMQLRELIGAGEPLNPEIIEQVRSAWGVALRDGFGQTETTAQIGNPPGQLMRPGSMGRSLPGYRVVLLDADDREADEGEVCLVLDPAPLGLMLGYLDSPEKTAEVMRNGYYRTGDVARRDDDGYITYVGRADDVFKASDYRISPFELESVLIEHPAIVEAAVVPSPDPIRLAVPKAFIALRQGCRADSAQAKHIFSFLRDQLAPYKRIRRIEFADLPKTISGKIRRVDLRMAEAARRRHGEKGTMEFFEEDFPEVKG
ncbi:AMP-binding protein [Noviherbaspirillum sp. ST9]|uniref:AMP-binding protein n=1 Tax=Noviherbaspirillum sp. ST9 TaxID=3401606 RepID=UPI003B588A1C